MPTSKIEEMTRQERLEYFRQWRAKNKDKVRNHNQTYWAKRALQKLAGQEENRNASSND